MDGVFLRKVVKVLLTDVTANFDLIFTVAAQVYKNDSAVLVVRPGVAVDGASSRALLNPQSQHLLRITRGQVRST